jgi:hypothetical protein
MKANMLEIYQILIHNCYIVRAHTASKIEINDTVVPQAHFIHTFLVHGQNANICINISTCGVRI